MRTPSVKTLYVEIQLGNLILSECLYLLFLLPSFKKILCFKNQYTEVFQFFKSDFVLQWDEHLMERNVIFWSTTDTICFQLVGINYCNKGQEFFKSYIKLRYLTLFLYKLQEYQLTVMKRALSPLPVSFLDPWHLNFHISFYC